MENARLLGRIPLPHSLRANQYFQQRLETENEMTYSIHISTAKTWRGGENQIWLLARGLQKRGQKVLVVAPRKSPLLERCQASGIAIRALGLRGELDPVGALRLMRLLRIEKPDVLHLHDGHAILPGQLAARGAVRGRKLKVVAHRRTVFKLRGKWKYQGRVDKIIAISQSVKACLLAGGIAAERICVVYSGLEFPEPLDKGGADARAFHQTHGIPNDALLLAHAAALSVEKRQGDIIHAVSKANSILKEKVLPDVHLAIAGAGDEEKSLRDCVRDCGMVERVHFAGFLSDLSPLWAASSMVIFASEAEGLCTALIEAQGAGLPAVITKAGGMTEVVAHEKTGLCVEIGDVAGMAEAIVRLCVDENLRQRAGEAAAIGARARFSADAMVEGILNVYRE